MYYRLYSSNSSIFRKVNVQLDQKHEKYNSNALINTKLWSLVIVVTRFMPSFPEEDVISRI